jgi:hypothetical protein
LVRSQGGALNEGDYNETQQKLPSNLELQQWHWYVLVVNENTLRFTIGGEPVIPPTPEATAVLRTSTLHNSSGKVGIWSHGIERQSYRPISR